MSTDLVDPETAAELEAIDTAREAAYAALKEANGRGVRACDLTAMLEAMDALDVLVTALHKRVWPRHRGRLVVALGVACLVSPTGRSGRVVWERASRSALEGMAEPRPTGPPAVV